MTKSKDQQEAPPPNPNDVLARMLAMPPDPKKAPKKKTKKPRK